jgi:hypothetical protein
LLNISNTFFPVQGDISARKYFIKRKYLKIAVFTYVASRLRYTGILQKTAANPRGTTLFFSAANLDNDWTMTGHSLDSAWTGEPEVSHN